jgi:inner membrane transporter RhtA
MELTAPTAAPAARSAQGVGLLLGGVVSVQFGAALGATLFPVLGPVGAVTLRLVGAGLVLGLVARPRLRGRTWAQWRVPIAFGLLTVVMNTCIYLSIARLPLGAVITIEFLGPLGLALALSRRWLDALWAVCAGVGVVLLGDGLAHLDLAGVAFALVGAGCWAVYILLNRRMGAASSGGLRDLALATVVGAALIAPVGLAVAGPALLDARAVALGLLVGVLSSALPYALDLMALRRLAPRVFGVLTSVNPAVAALAGWLVLDQWLTGLQAAAIGLVTAAGIGVTATASGGKRATAAGGKRATAAGGKRATAAGGKRATAAGGARATAPSGASGGKRGAGRAPAG